MGSKQRLSLERGCFFRISGISAPLKELTFSQFFHESVRFSDRWNSGRISSRRVEIQQEFRNGCEGIPAGIPERLLKPHAKRAGGTVADIYVRTGIAILHLGAGDLQVAEMGTYFICIC